MKKYKQIKKFSLEICIQITEIPERTNKTLKMKLPKEFLKIQLKWQSMT